jgi:hypothetical protein
MTNSSRCSSCRHSLVSLYLSTTVTTMKALSHNHIQTRVASTDSSGISSGVRTLALEARGPTFESSISDIFARLVWCTLFVCATIKILCRIAKLVRRRALNAVIVGSSPTPAELCVSSMGIRLRVVIPKKRVRVSSRTPCARRKESNLADRKPAMQPCKSARALHFQWWQSIADITFCEDRYFMHIYRH